MNCYTVSELFNPADELGCRFDDTELGIPWPTRDVVLSARDHDLPPMRTLLHELEPHQDRLFRASP